MESLFFLKKKITKKLSIIPCTKQKNQHVSLLALSFVLKSFRINLMMMTGDVHLLPEAMQYTVRK